MWQRPPEEAQLTSDAYRLSLVPTNPPPGTEGKWGGRQQLGGWRGTRKQETENVPACQAAHGLDETCQLAYLTSSTRPELSGRAMGRHTTARGSSLPRLQALPFLFKEPQSQNIAHLRAH